MRLVIISGLLFAYATAAFGQISLLPSFPADVKISCPKSNPLKDALKPVLPSAVFNLEGYYLWDPSVTKVGDTNPMNSIQHRVFQFSVDGRQKY